MFSRTSGETFFAVEIGLVNRVYLSADGQHVAIQAEDTATLFSVADQVSKEYDLTRASNEGQLIDFSEDGQWMLIVEGATSKLIHLADGEEVPFTLSGQHCDNGEIID